MRPLRSVMLCLVVVMGAAAHAQAVYRWTDETGETHYTNQPDQIPLEFRKAAERTDGAELSVVRAIPENRPAGKGGPPAMEAPEPAPVPPGEARRAGGFEGPSTEDEWRVAFQSQRARLALARSELAQAQNETRRSNSTAAHARVKEARRELTAVKQALQGLEREASLAKVPATWRQ